MAKNQVRRAHKANKDKDYLSTAVFKQVTKANKEVVTNIKYKGVKTNVQIMKGL